MKNVLVAVFLLTLLGCSNPKKTVFDSLTSTSSNDGVVMSGKWINPGYPMQTTVVSHNGQLFLEVGQLCLASNFRAPTAIICSKGIEKSDTTKLQKVSQKLNGKVSAPEVLETIALQLNELKQNKIELLSLLSQTEKEFNDYLKNECTGKTGTDEKTCAEKFFSQPKSKPKSKQESEQESEQESKGGYVQRKYDKLYESKNALQIALTKKNLLIYDWSQSNAVAVSQDKDAKNKLTSNNNKNGLTVVSGYTIERIVYDCEAIKDLRKQYKGSKNIVKLVTMTLSTGDLYYRAYKDSLVDVEASLSIELKPELKQILKNALGGKQFDTTLNISSKVASQGLISSSASDADKSNSHNLTYYAVLTDLETLAGTCPMKKSAKTN